MYLSAHLVLGLQGMTTLQGIGRMGHLHQAADAY
jgi:hypothetical protein